MDHFAKLIAALVLSFAGTAHAGYAQARPPSGWSPGTYAPSANDSVYGRVIHSPNGPTTTVGGQAVKMSASYRFAANAPRIAAGIIFSNPYLRAGIAISSWLGVANIVWDAAQQKWISTNGDGQIQSNGSEYQVPGQARWYPNIDQACRDYHMSQPPGSFTSIHSVVQEGGNCRVIGTFTAPQGSFKVGDPYATTYPFRRRDGCPAGWYYTPAGCTLTPQPKTLNEEEFKDALAPKPMPDRVPLELPQPSPLPIEHQPFINPEPGSNPQHRPLFIPSGDPVPNPNYDPNAAPGPNNQPYMQPGTRIVPSPTPSQPWRVDHQPVNRPQDDATPNPNPDAEPGTDPADKPKPEEQQSLCEKHPDIVACAKLGEPGQVTPVPNETKTLTIAPENGFGPSGGSCPPPRTVQVAGITLSMPFDLLCDFATGLKPVIVGLAWLTAAFTFMGIGRRS